ncbi:MAG: DUF1156 domain-containing protein, partial [Candidatus Methylomirabilis sp.]
VLFASVVDDPSSNPERFPTEEAQNAERERLLGILRRLMQKKMHEHPKIYAEARTEMLKHAGGKLPPVLDPFAGGGSIPLEAARLGFEAHAADLNPVAVLLNKCTLELVPRWLDQPPINPETRKGMFGKDGRPGARGLAEDVRYYGRLIRERGIKKIGHLYPKVKLPKEYGGREANVIAWLWARTVASPNPAARGAHVPLISTYWLSSKKESLAWLEPVVEKSKGTYRFAVRTGTLEDRTGISRGTKVGKGSNFTCLLTGAGINGEYIQDQARSSRLGERLLAIVADLGRGRAYVAATAEHQALAEQAKPQWYPEELLSTHPQYMGAPRYGMTRFGDLFTPRQLTALVTFSDLVREVRKDVLKDAREAGLPDREAEEYAKTVTTFLALAVDRCADFNNSLCRWKPSGQQSMQLFARQAIPMVWDFCEPNIVGQKAVCWLTAIDIFADALETLPTPGMSGGYPRQIDAATGADGIRDLLVSTDPPYYDNIPYSDISDFFKQEDEEAGDADEAESGQGTNSVDRTTGWETLLEALLGSGFRITATWPVRASQSWRMRAMGSNALASYIVLACRPRSADAPQCSRREFIAELKRELPAALKHLQQGNIAPVDLAQASIGPGMAVFSRFSRVMGSSGNAMTVRTALSLINQTLDEVLAEQEAEFDTDTRWALAWFEQYGMTDGQFGDAETLSKAKNTAVNGLVEAGIISARGGKVRLVGREELPKDWDPASDKRLTVWEATQHLIRALEQGGESAAAELLRKLGSGTGETARELSYRLYKICERKDWSKEALSYNGLVVAWPEIVRLAHAPRSDVEQRELFRSE